MTAPRAEEPAGVQSEGSESDSTITNSLRIKDLLVGNPFSAPLLTLFIFTLERKRKLGRSNSITLQNSQGYK